MHLDGMTEFIVEGEIRPEEFSIQILDKWPGLFNLYSVR